MVETSERHELEADEVSRLLAAHGAERARGALVIGAANPARVWWANRAAAELFGSDLAEVLDGRLFGGSGRQGLVDAIGRLVPGAGARQERLRLSRGFATRTVPVTISRWRLGDQDVLVLSSVGGETSSGDDLTRNVLREPIHAPSVPDVEDDRPDARPRQDAGSAADRETAPRSEPLRVTGGLAAPAPGAPPPHGAESARKQPDAAPAPAPERLTALGGKRFLWESDADGRLVRIDDAVTALGHLGDGSLLGRLFATALGEIGAVGGERLASLLDAQRSFSNALVGWPLAEPGWSTDVLLGAVPVRGTAGAFTGFRGFGVMDFGKLTPRPAPSTSVAARPVEAPEPPAPAPAAQPLPAARDGTDPQVADTQVTDTQVTDTQVTDTQAVVDASQDAGPKAATPEAPRVSVPPARPAPAGAGVQPTPFSTGKVVALRPSRPQSEVDPPAASGEGASLSPAEEVMNLSSSEQMNFDAIARALRKASAATVAAADAVRPAPGDAVPMLEGFPVAAVVLCGGLAVWANQAFASLTGYGSAAQLQEAGGLIHLLGGLDAAKVTTRDTDSGFPIVGAAGAVIAVDGRRVAVEWRGEPAEMLVMRAAPDRVAQMQALEMEVKRIAAASEEARALLDRVDDAVAVLDGSGRILFLNGAATRLFGRAGADAVGESIGAFLSAEGQSAVLGAVFAAGAAGPDADEVSIPAAGRRRPGATPFDVRVRALTPGRVGLVAGDRSVGDALREQALHLRDELDNAARTRADFLAKVSHEIRTPLNSIVGFAELMLEERFGPLGNARYHDYLTDIHDAGKHVVGLLGDLVSLSSAASVPPADTPAAATDVNAVVGESVAELQGQAHRDRVIVRQSLAGNLPRALVDAEAMRQVMTNILSNAIQFNEPGGQVIVSTALHESGAVVVRVRDTGIGMSDAELAIAMEPFRQVGSGKPGTGSGLGLPLTRALVEANHATLSIRSRKSEGTLVEVSLRPAPATADLPG